MAAIQKNLGLILIICMFLIVSCTEPKIEGSSGAQKTETPLVVENPKTFFKELVGKASESDDFGVVYDVNSTIFELMSTENDLGEIDIDIGLFKKGEKEKMVMEVTGKSYAIASFYQSGEKQIACEKGNPTMVYDESSEYGCMMDEEIPDDAMPLLISLISNKFIDQFNHYSDYIIEYKGERKILDRKCYEFALEIEDFIEFFIAGIDSEEDLAKNMFESEFFLPKKANMELCLDAESGHELYSKVIGVRESKITDDSYTDFGFSKAKRFEIGIDDSEFELPVKFVIERDANNADEILIYVLPFEGVSGHAELRFYDKSVYDYGFSELYPLNVVDLGDMKFEALRIHEIKAFHEVAIGDNSSTGSYSTTKSYALCIDEKCTKGEYDYKTNSLADFTEFDCLSRKGMKECGEVDGCVFNDPYCEVYSLSKW